MESGYVIFLCLLGGAVFLLSQVLIVPTFGSDARARKLLRRKLAEIDSVDAHREVASLLRQKYLGDLSPFARRLEDSRYMESLGRMIEQSGVRIMAHRLRRQDHGPSSRGPRDPARCRRRGSRDGHDG
jgi:tight adherence protein B